jgi:hypothetical protein
MSTPTHAWKAALEYIWGQYRVWSATSRAYKSRLSYWRRVVLTLSLAGAVVGTLSSQQAVPWASLWGPLPKALGLLSAALLGLAAYFSKEVLSPDREARWIRARATAEAFKREAYLLLAQAPPYDGAITPASLQRARDMAAAVQDLEPEPLSEEKKREQLPAAALAVDEYIRDRVKEQMNGFYVPKAEENRRKARRIKNWSLGLGAVAVALGFLGALWVGVPAFVAVITTITTALAAHLYAGRYQYLVVSYLATARKLEELLTTWEMSGQTDAERGQFILHCEEAFAAENSAWMAEWTKPSGPPKPPAGGAKPGP